MTTIEGMDDQELSEREEEASERLRDRVFEKHLCNYVEECIRESKDTTEEVRETWSRCWNAHNNHINYAAKEDWQSKIILNDPFAAVMQAKAVIKKGLESAAELFSIQAEEPTDDLWAEFCKDCLDFWTNRAHAQFTVNFSDAAEMALAIGQSQEIIPVWDSEKGLMLELVEPWKIFRDPDAQCRKPWSGMYWIHEEWVDLWALKEKEKQGIYENVSEVKRGVEDYDRKEADKRREYLWTRNKYREAALVREFRGVLLDEDGDLLLPNCTFTVAGGANGTCIQSPYVPPFQSVRWPGTSFSPMPHLLRYEGRGILEGIITLWLTACNLLNLHMDDLNFHVNGIKEIFQELWTTPQDLSWYPGKSVIRKDTNFGMPSILFNRADSVTKDILANFQMLDQVKERGSFVNHFVAGLPGHRSQITKGEVELKTAQSMGVFDMMGKDIELGGTNGLRACLELIMLNWSAQENGSSIPSMQRVFGPEKAQKYRPIWGVIFDIEARKEKLKLNCDIDITGISQTLKENEMLQRLYGVMTKAEHPAWAMYLRKYPILEQATKILDLPDDVLIQKEIGQMIDQMQLQNFLNPPPPPPPQEKPGGAPETPGPKDLVMRTIQGGMPRR